MQQSSGVRVVVADPVPAARAALCRLLAERWSWSVAGQSADGLEAVRMARATNADVLLVDWTVQGLTLTEIRTVLPEGHRTLVVGLVERPEHLAHPGVSVLKSAPAETLHEVVTAHLGQLWQDRADAELGT